MRPIRRNLSLIAATAIVIATGLVTFGLASAADPVTIKLNPWMQGDVNVIDVSIVNNTSDNLRLDVKAFLPVGATFVSASPSYKLAGGYVQWFGTVSPGKTLVGYQYKFKASSGSTSVSIDAIGSTRATVTSASLAVSGTTPATAAATKPPAGTLALLAIPASATTRNAITATLASTKAVVAMGTTGLENVSVGVPVTMEGASSDSSAPAKSFRWTLTAPTASKAKLDKADAKVAKFTPDVVGTYKVDLVASNEAGSSSTQSIQIRAGTYIGVDKGSCKSCHPGETKEWAETNHAKIMTREIDGGEDPQASHYGEGCLRCHTTGYYLNVANGGFADVQAQTGWKFPALASIQTGEGNWAAVPAELKNMGNIQCEACHGPASQHVNANAPMAASLDAGVCNVCHNGGGHHTRGAELANAKHGEESSQAWTYPTGPARQDCVRCHSGAGYVSFTKNPTEKSTWNNEAEPATCAVCHDPHSDANKFQLRIAGKPVEANGITKDFGLSATCVECHNGRVQPAAAKNASFPHYSTAGEALSNTGGVDYGQKIVDSPHGLIVGASPVKDPSDATGKALLFGGVAPGPCVACHMWPQPADTRTRTISPSDSIRSTRRVRTGLSSIRHPASLATRASRTSTCRRGPTTTGTVRRAPYRQRWQDFSRPSRRPSATPV